MKHAHQTVGSYRLIADYHRRPVAQDLHEANVKQFNDDDKVVNEVFNNNAYAMQWLTCTSVAVYTWIAGVDVINHTMPLGVFLTTMRVIMQVGSLWNDVYGILLEIMQVEPMLIRVVDLTNLPSDVRDRMAFNRMNSREMHRELNVAGGAFSDESRLRHLNSSLCVESSIDMLSIRVSNLEMDLVAKGTDLGQMGVIHRETRLQYNNLTISQGHLVAFVGKSGKGKTTLLRILGGATFPRAIDNGKSMLFIPPHLRVLHVPTEPLFVKGGLYANLTFGIAQRNDMDGRIERVKAICRRLGLTELLVGKLHPDDRSEVLWTESLSSTEQHLICIARALIANPEVLCLHKPTLHVSAEVAESIIKLLREFVDKRGIEEDEATFTERRPRTCIITSTRAKSLALMDEVYRVHAVFDDVGTSMNPAESYIEAIDRSKVNAELTLDDFC